MNSSTRRWTTPLALIIMLALLAAGSWFGWKQLTRPFGEEAQVCVTQEAASLTTAQVTVKVLNGGTQAGLAGQITEQLQAKGFITESPANTKDDVAGTMIIGATADDPAVQLVAGFFTDAVLEGDGRTSGIVDVLVGDNFAGFIDSAPTEIAVPGGQVCLPAPSTESPTPTAG